MACVTVVLILASYFYQANTEVCSDDKFGSDWVVFVDDEGRPHYVNLTATVEDILYPKIRPVFHHGQARFWLYTRNTMYNPEELVMPFKNNKNYIPGAPLVVVVHGWLNHRDSDSVQFIKDAYLTYDGSSDNVVIMDWSSMQSEWNYIHSATATITAGEKLKHFVQILANIYKISGSNIRMVGHSLGAHVVGIAGSRLRSNGIILSRVTGLDPARPYFELPRILPGITKNAAAFVDIIHTSIGFLGICEPVGHADFYPGGGIYQPAICPPGLVPGFCEHRAAYKYFALSFTKKFPARKCHDYFMYLTGLCNRNNLQYMGEPCEPTARGSYYLDITIISPN